MSLLGRLFGTDETEECDHDWREWVECPAGDWHIFPRHWRDGENKPFVFITIHEARTCRNCDETETRNKRQLRQYLEISHSEEIPLEDSDPDG